MMMKINDIHDVIRKYTITFALISCGTATGNPFMNYGESYRMVSHSKIESKETQKGRAIRRLIGIVASAKSISQAIPTILQEELNRIQPFS